MTAAYKKLFKSQAIQEVLCPQIIELSHTATMLKAEASQLIRVHLLRVLEEGKGPLDLKYMADLRFYKTVLDLICR